MRNYNAQNVDDYIADSAVESRSTMETLRRLIKSTIPEVQESIKWGVPFYEHHGLLAGFSVFKKHITFGLAFVFDDNIRQQLEQDGYTTGKKTVQIKFDQKIPSKIIKHILISKAKSNESK